MERQVKLRTLSFPEIAVSDDLILECYTPGTPPWLYGEHDLLQGILLRTLLDLGDAKERDGAIEWIRQEADSADPWTLPWICEYLNLDFETVLANFNTIIENKIRPQRYQSSKDKGGWARFQAKIAEEAFEL